MGFNSGFKGLTLFVPMCSILKQSTIVFRLTHL